MLLKQKLKQKFIKSTLTHKKVAGQEGHMSPYPKKVKNSYERTKAYIDAQC